MRAIEGGIPGGRLDCVTGLCLPRQRSRSARRRGCRRRSHWVYCRPRWLAVGCAGGGSRSEFAVVSVEFAYAAATSARISRWPLRRSCRVRCRVFAAGPSSSAPARPRYASESSMFVPGLLCRARLSWRLACCRTRFIVAPDRRSSTLGFGGDLPGIRRLRPVFCGYGASMMFRQRLLAFFSR